MLPEPVDTSKSVAAPINRALLRDCPVCHTGFTVESALSKRLYCSPTCRSQGILTKTLVTRHCPACQNEFQTPVRRQRAFCSKECRTSARDRDEMRETRTCVFCDGDFTALKTVRQTYCSDRCRKAAGRRRDRHRDEERALRLGEPPRPRSGELQPAQARPELPALPPPPAARTTTRARAARDVLEPAATRNCPHCDQPITIVALLATPEAARPIIHPAGGMPQLRRVP